MEEKIDAMGIITQKKANVIRKEIFRKFIHLATAFVPFLLSIAKEEIMFFLAIVLCTYCCAELFRLKGIRIFIFSSVTEIAARKRDENKFVLGPVTLALGVLITAYFFDEKSATIAIYALAFGDGLASLVGKFAGTRVIPYSFGKTVEGSFTCSAAIFLSTFFVTQNPIVSILISIVGTLIEILPLKDFDNLLIPIVLASISQYYFHM